MDDRVVIALFRHGLTEANQRMAYLGWSDSPLCAETQIRSSTSRYDIYFSSDLGRCVKTANLLFPNENVCLLHHLREMNFGKWEGKTYEELKNEKQYQLWLSDFLHYCPPGGESFQQFINRVQAGWEKIIEAIQTKQLERCAVITHGGVIKYLLSQLAPEQKEFWSWQIPHDYGFELIFDRESLRRSERCTLLQVVPLTEKEHG
jgi:alpha-ribazole phosphatase